MLWVYKIAMSEEQSGKDMPYTNREVREKWHDIANSLTRIELQTTTTNGRVSKLEKWQSFISGGMTVIVIIVVPLLGWSLYVLSTINEVVHHSVDEAISAYNITK